MKDQLLSTLSYLQACHRNEISTHAHLVVLQHIVEQVDDAQLRILCTDLLPPTTPTTPTNDRCPHGVLRIATCITCARAQTSPLKGA